MSPTRRRGVDPPGRVQFGGTVDAAFSVVGDAFRDNFSPHDDGASDLGAALCVIAGARVVVDCWGGWREPARRTPWTADTLVNAYSVLKPVVAVLALTLVEDGRLDLDEPLARVWPELGSREKEGVTLRRVLAHRAGLPAVHEPLDDDVLFDWDAMCGALAATAPWWEPGTAHGYHVNTFGFLAGEPVRRATGTEFGAALRDRLAGPLDLDLWVGLPDAELGRVADVDVPAPPTPDEAGTGLGPAAAAVSASADGPTGERAAMVLATYFNPRGFSGFGVVNTPAWRRAMVPSTNGHATARAVAGFYASLLPGAPRPALGSALLAEATTTHSAGPDLVLGRPTRFGLGFALHQDERPVGVSPEAFGHYGYGGSLGFADPVAGVAFCFLLSRPGDRWREPRTRRVLDALRSCL